MTKLLFSLLLLAAGCRTTAPPGTPPLPAAPAGPAISVAVLAPSTGEMFPVGRRMQNGIVMAFDRWNAEGGLLQHRIDWQVYDSGCDFETGRRAAGRAIAAGHQFIIGPLCSEAAIAAATVAEAHGVVMVAPTATHPLVTVDGSGQTRLPVFRASYASPWQGRAAALFAVDRLALDKTALLYDPDDDYAAGLARSFTAGIIDRGGLVVHRAPYPAGTTDFTNLLQDIQRAEAGLIYLPAPASIVNQVAGQLDAFSDPPVLLGSDSWQSSQLEPADTAGSYYTLHFTAADDRPQIQSWAAAYRAAYALEPDTLAALGYDAANLLALAVHRAGTFEASAVVEALEQGAFEGVTGPFSFDAQHNPHKPVPLVEVEPEGPVFTTVISP